MSQLQLSLVMDISQRHLCFVERGRAQPSRELISDWLKAVEASPELTEAVMLRAIVRNPEPTAIHPAPAVLREPLSLLLSANNPYPIVLFNAHWVMLGMNAAGEWLAQLVMARYWAKTGSFAAGLRMIDALVDDDGLFRHMTNARAAGASLAAQIERESWTCSALADPLDSLRRSLSRRYGGVSPSEEPNGERRFVFQTSYGGLSFYPIQSVYRGPASAVTAAVRIEHWLPADARTHALMNSQSSSAQ